MIELEYATKIATLMWEKHYQQDAPHWHPAGDLMGVLTQIDNMLTGLARPTELRAQAQEILACLHQPNPTDPSRWDVAPGKHLRFCNAIPALSRAIALHADQ